MEADVVNTPIAEPSPPAQEDETIIHQLESFSLTRTRKLRSSSKSLPPRKRFRSSSGSEDKDKDSSLNYAIRIRRLPPKTYLRRSKLDHVFKCGKRPVLRASILSRRSGSAPPENRTGLSALCVKNSDSRVNLNRTADKVGQLSLRESKDDVKPSPKPQTSEPAVQVHKSCSQEAANLAYEEVSSVDELAGYLENNLHIPKKMSKMAEMMYT